MMKTLCVAVIVLSLSSVCQHAPLDDQSPDLTGKWNLVAISSDVCLFQAYVSAFSLPSFAVDIVAEDEPHFYNATVQMKVYGLCMEMSGTVFYKNSKTFAVDRNNTPNEMPGSTVILQDGCDDCRVFKKEDVPNTFLLFSRRQNIDEPQLEEFSKHAVAGGASKPLGMSLDYDFENCTQMTADKPMPDLAAFGITSASFETMINTYEQCSVNISSVFQANMRTLMSTLEDVGDNLKSSAKEQR
ncbi:uncharacterized protein LOC121507212 [Cheilinus undulatus]|uniref:uncharacterized protein LOC121507212 n=1 Tax=Cheilinus undulatus TaxID=241271 RepID=UPI001BD39766|nr:uncharacterized protein LOC121507212 [Cheilinus undulatus]